MKTRIIILLIYLFANADISFSQKINENKIICPTCKGSRKCWSCSSTNGRCVVCEGSKKHIGDCPNCKNWNELYRLQVPCHKCKSSRVAELPGCQTCMSTGICSDCKGSKICYSCKGKSYFDPYVNSKVSNLVKLPNPNECSVEIKLISGYIHPNLLKTYYINDALYPELKYDKKEKIIFCNNERIAINIIGNYYNILSKNYLEDDLNKESSNSTLNLANNFWEIGIKNRGILFYRIKNNNNNEGLWLTYNDSKIGCEQVANALLIYPNSKKMFIDLLNDSDVPQRGSSNQIKKTVFIYNGIDDEPDFEPHISQNKECNDYPFTLGCINVDIGDINEKFFGKGNRRANLFSTKLLNSLKSYGYIMPNDKDPKITQDIYNRIMKNFTKDKF